MFHVTQWPVFSGEQQWLRRSMKVLSFDPEKLPLAQVAEKVRAGGIRAFVEHGHSSED
jgi:hypothetical protein